MKREHIGAKLYGFCLEDVPNSEQKKHTLRVVELLNRVQPVNKIQKILSSHLVVSTGDCLQIKAITSCSEISAQLVIYSKDHQSQVVHPSQQEGAEFNFRIPLWAPGKLPTLRVFVENQTYELAFPAIANLACDAKSYVLRSQRADVLDVQQPEQEKFLSAQERI